MHLAVLATAPGMARTARVRAMPALRRWPPGLVPAGVLVSALLVASACGAAKDPGGVGAPSSSAAVTVGSVPAPGSVPRGPADPGTTSAPAPPRRGVAGKPPRTHDPVLVATVEDLQRFWAGALPAYARQPYRALPPDGLVPFDVDALPPPCGGRSRSYDQVRGNAFFCPPDRFIAWDDGEFLPRLARDAGDGAVALVLAHEWGHLVQDETGFKGEPLILELQADCLAGMWFGHAADLTADPVLGPTALDSSPALAGLLLLRDEPGTDLRAGDPHGSGFDRIHAFERGYRQQRCFDFDVERPSVLAIDVAASPSAPATDRPYAEAWTASVAVLNAWWSEQRPGWRPITDLRPFRRTEAPAMQCGPDRWISQMVAPQSFLLCPSEGWLAYDEDLAHRMEGTYGDGALLALLAVQFAGMDAGRAAGSPGFDLFAGAVARECRTGALVHDLVAGKRPEWALTVPDLDGVVAAMLYTRPVAGGGPAGGVVDGFLAVRFLEQGFTQGVGSCDLPAG